MLYIGVTVFILRTVTVLVFGWGEEKRTPWYACVRDRDVQSSQLIKPQVKHYRDYLNWDDYMTVTLTAPVLKCGTRICHLHRCDGD